MPGPYQITIILVVVLLLFGAKRIPEIAGAIGKGIKEFKKAGSDNLEEGKKKEDDSPKA